MGKLNDAIETLAEQMGDRFYLDIAKWHLYLKDAKIHLTLAERFYALLEEDRLSEDAVGEILQETAITVGSGRAQFPLKNFLPVGTERDLLDLLSAFRDDYF